MIRHMVKNFLQDICIGQAEENIKTAIYLLLFSAVLLSISIFYYITHSYHWAFHEINALARYIPPVILHHITVFGDTLLLLSIILYFSIQRKELVFTSCLTVIIGTIIVQSIKRYYDTPRPPSILDEGSYFLIGQTYYGRSFPSGHTMTAFMIASLCMLFSKNQWLKINLIGAATLVGLSRIWLGIHWPIDVIVGASLGMTIAVVVFFISVKLVERLPIYWFYACYILLVTACILSLFMPSDYVHARLLFYSVAMISLYRSIKHILKKNALLTVFSLDSRAMLNILRDNSLYIFFLLLALILFYRIFVIYYADIALFYDEIYYYHWSLNLDSGYYSKPPVIAWVIRIFTELFGSSFGSSFSSSTLAIKLASPLLYCATAYVIFSIVRYVKDTFSACIASLVFFTAPLISFNSLFITTDAPLLFFWSLSLYFFILALYENKLRYWCLLGTSVGLSILSKYTALLMPLSLLCVLIASDNLRYLLHKRLWLSLFISFSIISLNIFWNYQHDWISFKHTQAISNSTNYTFNIEKLLEFLLAQAIVLGPVTLYLITRLFKRYKTQTLEHDLAEAHHMLAKTAIFSSLILLLVVSVQALLSHAYVNWAGPWIIGAALLIGLYVESKDLSLVRKLCISNLLLAFIFYHWPQLMNSMHVDLSRKNNPYQRIMGWDQLAHKITPIIVNYPNTTLSSDSRDMLAYMSYYLRRGNLDIARWNEESVTIQDHYDLKFNIRRFQGKMRNFIHITQKPILPTALSRFEKARFLGKVTHNIYPDLKREAYIYYLSNLKEYPVR